MRSHTPRFPRWLVVVLGLALGSTAGIAATSLAGAAAVRQSSPPARDVLDATHVPPLLSLPNETIELSYDVHCARGDSSDVDAGCTVRGTVFVRPSGERRFDELPLRVGAVDGVRQLSVSVPDWLASHHGGFEYFALIEAPELDRDVVVPAGGAEAPHVSRRLESSIEVSLGRHRFGAVRQASARVASARWGTGSGDVGLEQGRSASPVGASAFDVDASGAVVLLDQAHRRLLRWMPGRRAPERIPLSVAGTLADMTVANDGSIYVLESVAEPGRNPRVRRFDDSGRELGAIEMAERTASQIHTSPLGPLVLSQPSNHWMPVEIDGAPASPSDQLGHGRSGRAVGGGTEIVVYRHANELRVALVSEREIVRSWRLTSDAPLAEVQLAESVGQRLVLVVRVYGDSMAEFKVLVLDRRGLSESFSLDSADWAETAPIGRFELFGRSLYRLGSTPTGAFVDRFDLEVH